MKSVARNSGDTKVGISAFEVFYILFVQLKPCYFVCYNSAILILRPSKQLKFNRRPLKIVSSLVAPSKVVCCFATTNIVIICWQLSRITMHHLKLYDRALVLSKAKQTFLSVNNNQNMHTFIS